MSTLADRQPVYVWDLVVRLTHWFIVLGILVLSATGFYISHPFAVTHGGFVTGWVRIVHSYAAVAFTTAVAARIAWMFLARSPYARWTQLVPVAKQRRRDLWGTFKFYSFLTAEPPPAVGHNALAGFSYIAVFGLYVLMIATGLGLYSVDSSLGSPSRVFGFVVTLLNGPQNARWVHHVGMYLLLGFMVHHIYSAMLMARVEKTGCMDSIFSGWKYVPRDDV